MERKIDCHGAVIGNRLWQTIVQVAHHSGEVGLEPVWPFQVQRIVKVGFHKYPIKLELGNANLPPDQFGHERRSEPGASALVGVG